jgi:hypothetical protein
MQGHERRLRWRWIGAATVMAAVAPMVPSLSDPSSAQGTPTVEVGDASIVEGHAGGPNVVKLPVSLSSTAPGDVLVEWTLTGIEATPGTDFKARSKPARTRIRAGKTAATVSVPVFGDTEAEGDERLRVTLTRVLEGDAQIGDRAVGTGTILDDDPRGGGVTVGIGDTTVVETEAGLVRSPLPFTLSEPIPGGTVEITWAVVADTATAGSDYKAVPKPKVTKVRPGKTRAAAGVVVLGDTTPEPTEQFSVEIRSVNVVGSPTPVTVGRGVGHVVLLDEVPPAPVSPATASPRNFLGTGSDPAGMLPDASYRENFWLAASGPCSSRENGDYLLPISDGNFSINPDPPDQNPGPTSGQIHWNLCTGSNADGTTIDLTDGTAGDSHDPDGYFYAVEVPDEGAGRPVHVWGFDLAHCPTGTGNVTGDNPNLQNHTFTTTYRLRGPDATPGTPTDNPLLATSPDFVTNAGTTGQCGPVSTPTIGGYRNGWRILFTIPSATAGVYLVQAQTSDPFLSAPERHGSNSFGLRASYTDTWDAATSACSTDATESALYQSDCLGVYALDWMSILANIPQVTMAFSLAQTDEGHAGKTLRVRLWDPGEGARWLELLDPLGRSVSFDWEVVDGTGSEVEPTGGWSGTVAQPGGPCTTPATCSRLDLLGDDPLGDGRGWNPQPGPYRGGRSKYNDRLLELRVVLPDDIVAAYGGLTWWRVRYTLGPPLLPVTDRTTWSAAIVG